jgi:hypothetical protein
MAVDAHNGGLEAQNGALESRIEEKSWIRIRTEVKR